MNAECESKMEKEKKSFWGKYREIIVYIIVGVATTVFCWALAWVCKKYVFDVTNSFQNFLNNTLNWVAGVSFAYPLNRKWVFKSKNPHVMQEYGKFALSRVSTWAVDVIIMWIFVNLWTFIPLIEKVALSQGKAFTEDTLVTINYWIAKIFISSVVVTIVNYIFSKLLVFKKKKDGEE